jgi:hypothetical protein
VVAGRNGHTQPVNISVLLVVLLVVFAASYAFWIAVQTSSF